MSTIKANQAVHGFLASTGQYDKSPHFLPENIERVRALISKCIEYWKLDINSLFLNCLDMGCGTGFMYEVLSSWRVGKYTGIDITKEMMDVCQAKYPGINLYFSRAEETSFEDESFTFICNYSFLDHLERPELVYAEAFRLIRQGGIFYSGLVPNSLFSVNIKRSKVSPATVLEYSCCEHLDKEYSAMFDNGTVYSAGYGIDPQVLQQAEPQKTKYHGLDPNIIYNQILSAGFSKVVLCPNWYFAQSSYKNNLVDALKVHEYLSSLGPVALPLFKYYDIFAIK